MRITIVGAGQAGLQLGIGLRQKKVEVSIVSNRTPGDILNGKVMSSQGMFDIALQSERDLGIDFGNGTAPTWTARGSRSQPLTAPV
jgi:2-polyprenyl-6-methoxyphenol hydroxylase-like FAD-dependent oxidoreductase